MNFKNHMYMSKIADVQKMVASFNIVSKNLYVDL